MSSRKEHYRFYAYTRGKLGISGHKIFEELREVYGEDAPSRATVFRWINFESAADQQDEELTFHDAARSGRPSSVRIPEAVNTVRELVEEDPRVSIRMLSELLESSEFKTDPPEPAALAVGQCAPSHLGCCTRVHGEEGHHSHLPTTLQSGLQPLRPIFVLLVEK